MITLNTVKGKSKELKKDLNIKWTYNSTGIEGNSYTLNQTRILLAEGITIGGKRLVEHLEIIGHSEAIEYLEDIIENNVELTEREIKNIHSLVTKDIENVNSGAYRNNAVYISGSKHIPPQPYLVSEKMEELMLWYNNESKNIHPIERAAILHGEFVSIHPFIDGNGRTARLLLNFELMKNNYPAIIIEIEEREKYFDALEVGNLSGNWDKFTEFVREKCEERIDYMNEFKISELKSRKWNKFKERLQDSDEEISEIVEDMKDDFTEHEIELLLSETGRDNDTKTKVK